MERSEAREIATQVINNHCNRLKEGDFPGSNWLLEDIVDMLLSVSRAEEN